MGESTTGLYSNASHSDRDQFLHFVRPRAQCVPLLRSSFVDISAPALHCCSVRDTKSQCTSIVGQMADRVSDPSLPRSTPVYPSYQIPPRSTLIHPGLPRSTQFYPSLPRSSKVYPGLPRSSKDYHGPTQTKVRKPPGAGMACVGSFAILQT